MRDELKASARLFMEFTLQVRDRLDQGENVRLEAVQNQMKGLHDQLRWSTTWSPSVGPQASSHDAFLGVGYPLVCMADELMIGKSTTPWQQAWTQRKLEWQLYQSNDRAWKLLEQAQLAEALADPDTLEIFWWAYQLSGCGVKNEGVAHGWSQGVGHRLNVRRLRAAPELPVYPTTIPGCPPLVGHDHRLWRWLSHKPRNEAVEVTSAWETGLEALRQAGIVVAETPIILVLGLPAGSEATVFEALLPPLQANPVVGNVPAYSSTPLRLFANRQAIYVSCSGASLLTRQAELLREVSECVRPPASAPGAHSNPFSTIALPAPNTALELEGAPTNRITTSLEENRHEVRMRSQRLRQTCQLLGRARGSQPPLNGILVFVPLSATRSEASAEETRKCMQHDLTVIHETLQLRCPVLPVVCELEQIPGGLRWLRQLSNEQRAARLGQSYPRSLEVRADAQKQWLEGSVKWLCSELIPALVQRAMLAPTPDTLEHNQELFRFCSHLRRHESRLAHVLTGCAGPWFLVGCYFAGTGAASEERAYLVGLVEKLHEVSGFVAWTTQRFKEDQRDRVWTWMGYASLLLMTVFLGLFVRALL